MEKVFYPANKENFYVDGSGEMGNNRNKATLRKTKQKTVAARAALRMSIS